MTKRYPRSRGLAELERLGLSHAEIAKAAGLKRTAVTMTMTRSRKASKTLRAVAHEKWGIVPAWWDEEATAPSSPKLDEKDVPLTTPDAIARAKRIAYQLLAEAEDDKLPPAERAKRLKIALDSMQSVDEMTGEAGKISIPKILAHPAWKQIEDAIVKVFGREQLEQLRTVLRPLEDVEA